MSPGDHGLQLLHHVTAAAADARSRVPCAQRLAVGIVHLHGGRMWAEQPASAAGAPQGARFCFAAPVKQMASPRARRIARQTVGRDDLRLLAALADAMVDAVYRLAVRELEAQHGRISDARFAVLGYGSLGGRALGFGSDLDLVFAYDAPHDAVS